MSGATLLRGALSPVSEQRERGSLFRRKAVAPRRRRRNLLLRIAGPLGPPLALLGLPLALAAWVLSAPQFALREVVAEGGARVPAAWLEGALAPLRGANLVRLELASAEARLRRHPWVAEAELTKELPGRLRVAVVERQPVALLARGGGLYFADQRGRAIAPVGPGGRAAADARGLLVVEAPERAPDGLQRALEVAADLGRANPTWAGNLTRVEVLGDRDFRLATAALPFAALRARGRRAAEGAPPRDPPPRPRHPLRGGGGGRPPLRAADRRAACASVIESRATGGARAASSSRGPAACLNRNQPSSASTSDPPRSGCSSGQGRQGGHRSRGQGARPQPRHAQGEHRQRRGHGRGAQSRRARRPR